MFSSFIIIVVKHNYKIYIRQKLQEEDNHNIDTSRVRRRGVVSIRYKYDKCNEVLKI